MVSKGGRRQGRGAKDCGEYSEAAGVVRSQGLAQATACPFRFLRQTSSPIKVVSSGAFPC
jgi:hypothetical protein